jgi:hypothetical protein
MFIQTIGKCFLESIRGVELFEWLNTSSGLCFVDGVDSTSRSIRTEDLKRLLLFGHFSKTQRVENMEYWFHCSFRWPRSLTPIELCSTLAKKLNSECNLCILTSGAI